MDVATLRAIIYRFSYPVAVLGWFLVRPRVRAAACIVDYEGRFILVRHTYGNRDKWAIPGGIVGRGEDPIAAARREVQEEVGLSLGELSHVTELIFVDHYKSVHLSVYRATAESDQVSIDRGEIAAYQWQKSLGLLQVGNSTRTALELVGLATK